MTDRKTVIERLLVPSLHWVGNGFPVCSLLSYPSQGRKLSPFLLLDYVGPARFPGDGALRVIAGDYEGTRGAARTHTPLNVWDLRLPLLQGHQAAVVVLRGTVLVNDEGGLRNAQLAVLGARRARA